MNVQDIIKETKAYRCLDCGECTGGCPIARGRLNYSPRLFVKRIALGFENRVLGSIDLWSCLTCGLCNERCPSEVDYVGFMRDIRARAFEADVRGIPSHDGLMQIIMNLQMLGLSQNRTGWLSDDLRVSDADEFLFYVGCLPYFEVVFEDLETNSLDAARNVIRILNEIGITPMVSNDEKCCGHDLLWSGDLEGFEKLARLNVDAIRRTGAEKVIFYCPECYETFATEYRRVFGDLGFEVVHITQLLAARDEFQQIRFKETPKTVAYQDPCRLGRFAGIYEEPREIITRIPGITLAEMDKERMDSVCCGSTQWMNCFACSKQIQIDRMREAKNTGADVLLTACPKCKIHFRCALRKSDIELEIMDLTTLVAEAMAD